MSTVFSLIMSGQIPGRFVWSDPQCVAISTIEPVSPGHVLVIPRQEVDEYWNMDPQLWAHLTRVSQIIGQAQIAAFSCHRSGLIVAGFEVPHVHIHVIALHSQDQLNLAKARSASALELECAADSLRQALRDLGHGAHVPADITDGAILD